MPSLFTELRRRNVFKVGAAYAIVAWLLIEVSSVLLPTFNAPEWIMQVFTLFVLLGFPVALLLAWAYEMTPEGIKSAADVKPSDSITPATGQRLNYVILGLVVLAVGFLVTDQYVLDEGIRASVVGTSRSVVTTPTLTPSVTSAPLRRYTIDLGPTEVILFSGLNAQVAVSQDGRRLAYIVQEPDDGPTSARPRLYMRALDQLEAELLTEQPGLQLQPFFSPDSQWVGFFTVRDRNLRKVSVLGGPPRVLGDQPTDASSTHYFERAGGSWGTNNTIVFSVEDDAGVLALSRISDAGGRPEQLVAPDPGRAHVWPHILPGDDAILFVDQPAEGGANEGRVAVLIMETREVRTIVEGGYRPQYAPTGHILFVRAGALWAVPFDLNRLETTGPEILVLEDVQQDGSVGGAAYAFSNDGMLVYARGGEVDGDSDFFDRARTLVWVDREGREESLKTAPSLFMQPRISPNGQRMVGILPNGRSVLEENNDVWVYDFVRSNFTRLTFSAGASNPIWTPDGERVVFAGKSDEGRGLFSKAADGSGEVELIRKLDNRVPASFSPDGERLILVGGRWVGDGTSPSLSSLEMTGESDYQPLLQTDYTVESAVISPDGRWIAFHSRETGWDEIHVRPYPDIERGQWQVSAGGGKEPRWGSDARELFFRYGSAVMVVTVDATANFSHGTPRVLFEGGGYMHNFSPSYDVSPDGQRFLMLRDAEQTDQEAENTQLIVVENWFEELRRLAPPSP